ncbi:MAG: phosphatase PAP2 family protein [Bacteroidales bacterium]
MEFLELIDREILLAINGFHSPTFDFIFYNISQTRTGLPLYAFIIIYLFKKLHTARAMQYFIVLILSVALADLGSVHLFKNVVERYRPSHNLEIEHMLHYVNDYQGGMYGFISSHAANLFALATMIYLIFKKHWLTKLVFIWACLGSYSRMYLGVHYPSDIIVGALFGSGVAYALHRFYFVNLVSPSTVYSSKIENENTKQVEK